MSYTLDLIELESTAGVPTSRVPLRRFSPLKTNAREICNRKGMVSETALVHPGTKIRQVPPPPRVKDHLDKKTTLL